MTRNFKTPLIALLSAYVFCPGTLALRGASREPLPSVFELPSRQQRHVELQRAIRQSFVEGRYADAEQQCLEAIQVLPQIPDNYYNLGCAQARQGQLGQATASLKKAVELGFRSADLMEKDPDLQSLREVPGFSELLAIARTSPPPVLALTYEIKPEPIRDRQAWVRESNTAWLPDIGVFRVVFSLPPESKPKADNGATPAKKPLAAQSSTEAAVIRGHGQVGDLLRQWFREGTAAGHRGDLYDNHDAGHSKLDVDAFPQLARIEFDETAKRLGLHIGLQCRFLYNCVTFGNSSMANTSGPYWRSLPRTAYAEPRLIQALYAQYNSNQLYVYPEHRDYDPGRNGKDGFGDVYCANTPYLLVSQGSSGSDRPFLEAIACTLAAFQPDVKSFLTERGILMPTLQMIFRFCGRPLDSPQDYLTGKAQPTVFQGENIDVLKMVQMAHAMPRESIPPLVRLRVVDEDQPVVGRDYFDVAARERWFDSPSAIARIVRATQYERRMVVSAEGSYDENKRPLTWHCAVLRGDAQLIRIRRLNEAGSRVELIVPYHERRPVAFSPGIESNRVDIGFFVHNGIYYSAPAFVTFHYLDSETRVYDARKRIESVTYADTKDGGNYVDPMIELRKNWRDEYRYDPQGRLIGWTRRRGEQSQEFTADGALVTKRDPQERALEARTVSYVASPSGTTVPALEQRPGDEILHYEYSSPTDLVGRISRRSTD